VSTSGGPRTPVGRLRPRGSDSVRAGCLLPTCARRSGAAWRLIVDRERAWLNLHTGLCRALEQGRLLVEPGGKGEHSVMIGVREVRHSVRAHAGCVLHVLRLLLGANGAAGSGALQQPRPDVDCLRSRTSVEVVTGERRPHWSAVPLHATATAPSRAPSLTTRPRPARSARHLCRSLCGSCMVSSNYSHTAGGGIRWLHRPVMTHSS
jgi:hypothetical protein